MPGLDCKQQKGFGWGWGGGGGGGMLQCWGCIKITIERLDCAEFANVYTVEIVI